jgi:hypothetical protein
MADHGDGGLMAVDGDLPPDAHPPDGEPAAGDAEAGAGPEVVGPAPQAQIGPCGVPEFEPNDSYETATPYTLGTALVGCIATRSEFDIYRFTAPAGDPSGGYFRMLVTSDHDRGFAANVIVRSAESVPIVSSYNQSKIGVPVYLYWATSPGQTYLVWVGADAVAATPARSIYTLKIDYTKVDDPGEPNDTHENPYPITLGTPISAYYFAGYRMGTRTPADLYDYYSIQVPTAGPATVTVKEVADELTLRATIYAPGNVQVEYGNGMNPGAEVTVPVTLEADTPYNIQISAISDAAAPKGLTATVPKAFMQPYQLIVTQP